MVRNKLACPHCGSMISKSNFGKHLSRHENNPSSFQINTLFKLDHDDLFCKFCGKECKNKNSLVNHERLCKLNPNAQQSSFVNYNKAVNKKVTARKVTVEQIEKQKETYRKNKELGLHKSSSHPHTAESKKKISDKLKNNQNSKDGKGGRGKKGWYKGFFCSSTYELAFLIYCIDHNIPVQKCNYVYDYTYKAKNHKYYPDFIINNTIVEIKGITCIFLQGKKKLWVNFH